MIFKVYSKHCHSYLSMTDKPSYQIILYIFVIGVINDINGIKYSYFSFSRTLRIWRETTRDTQIASQITSISTQWRIYIQKLPAPPPPPTGPNSFVFTYVFTEKHLCQRLAPPPTRVGAPPTENPGSAPGTHITFLKFFFGFQAKSKHTCYIIILI